MRLARISIAAVMLGSAAVLAVAAPAQASCPQGIASFEPQVNGTFAGTGINIRTGPGSDCTSRGQGQPGQTATFRCWTTGHDGARWTYLHNRATGVSGWSRSDLLSGGGATASCGI
ncbi:hypothetical protein C5N14_27635 [Micromonospora sp. MW-13]|uniref:SH3 domain-containing protein n=1 Tax=Micromonospora sp. MW-13 TaxID=2094022 RepID=UPI000EB9FB48|nr:SH3 domain-containing protein [Micromonospora sp. MW-13]RGC65678.1 hypothetical protein C5N14_27635 [Micromonospora sp. MW-13]